jgi:hypothetical protein
MLAAIPVEDNAAKRAANPEGTTSYDLRTCGVSRFRIPFCFVMVSLGVRDALCN